MEGVGYLLRFVEVAAQLVGSIWQGIIALSAAVIATCAVVHVTRDGKRGG